MKHLLRNLRGSLFWKHTLAVMMAAVVLVTLLPMDVKVAKANEEVLGSDALSAVQIIGLSFTYQATGEDLLAQPEGVPMYLPQDGQIRTVMTLSIAPSQEILEKNYVYTLPSGLVPTGIPSASVLDGAGREIATLGIAGTTVMLKFTEAVLENTGNVVTAIEIQGTVLPDAYGEGATCEIFFPAQAGNAGKTVTFSRVPLEELAAQATTEAASTEEAKTEATDTEATTTEAANTSQLSVINGGLYGAGRGTARIDNGLAPIANSETNIFDDTTIELYNMTLKASWQDSEGTHVEEWKEGDAFTVPYDADIDMRLDFNIGEGNAIVPGQEYVYKLPPSIRVDVDAEHELKDKNGTSIGHVKISPDGTLTFTFNENVKNHADIPFYVEFAGGFSEELQKEGQKKEIQFPTQNGNYNVNVETLGKTKDDEEREPGNVGMYKSGNVVLVNGKRYIEWTMALDPNGRDTLSGVIKDTLPEGLTYAAVGDYPKLTDTKTNNGHVDVKQEGQNIEITVTDVDTYWRANVKFLTEYNENIFGTGQITNATVGSVNNSAVFTPDDGTPEVNSTGTVTVTPDMIQKTGVIGTDGLIHWTVVINTEQLDISGATYKDTFGNGQELSGNVTITPNDSNASVSNTSSGFEITFSGSNNKQTYTVEYTTKITDYSVAKFTNKAELDGDKFDVEKDASVPGINLLDKSFVSYDPIRGIFTWKIVVNDAEKELGKTTVTDKFDTAYMKYLDYSCTGSAAPTVDESGKDNGTESQIVFMFDNLEERVEITIRFTVNPDMYNNGWKNFVNNVELDSESLTNIVEDSASTWLEITDPELLYKSGKVNGDGTVLWTVEVKPLDPQVTKIELKDILPKDMEYVPGSFTIQDKYWDANAVKLEPNIEQNGDETTLSYTLEKTDSELERFFADKDGFWITYLTKNPDPAAEMEATTYTNNATLTETFPDNSQITDTGSATVTGPLGGTLDKKYAYRSSESVVTWQVYINQARNDMSKYTNPTITDQLADYFDYISGTLYKINADGSRTPVGSGAYQAVCVNNCLTVVLPEINSDCYLFEFTTRFNKLSQELDGIDIVNHVTFQGTAGTFEQSSGSVENVQFSSSMAGSVLQEYLRVRKIDSVTHKVLEGARFELYLQVGSRQILVGEGVTDTEGYVTFEGVDPNEGYTFVLKETEAPTGYNGVTTDIPVKGWTITTEPGKNYYEIVVANEAISHTVEIGINKITEENQSLPGALFGLYADSACTTLITQKTSDAKGQVRFSVSTDDITASEDYYIKEIRSPEGYLANTEPVKVTITNTGSGFEVTYGDPGSSAMPSVVNKKAMGSLTITKTDTENVTITSSEATFELYADALATDRIEIKQTVNGVVTFENLELGKTYYYREVEAPDGYILDSTIHSFTIGTGKERADQTLRVTVTNEVAKGNIRIYKVDNSTPAKPLEGVTFTLYKKGESDPVVDGSGKAMTATTNARGIAEFTDIPFGDYVIKETGITGYDIGTYGTDGIEVVVDRTGNKEVTVVNKKIQFNIQITKTDSGTSVPLQGAEFGLYTEGGLLMRKGTTGSDGTLSFTNVPFGNYTVKEITPPEGYNKSAEEWKIQTSDITGNGVTLTKTFTNEKQNGSIELTKYGYSNDISDAAALAGAEFILYDSNGFPVGTATSDASGKVTFTDLPWGTYYVRESKAPDGYIRDSKQYEVNVSENGTSVTKDVTGNALNIYNKTISSEAPIISFRILKQDSDTGRSLAGAEFQLYANGEATGYTAVTDKDGYAYFGQISLNEICKKLSVTQWTDLTLTIQEETAPSGYMAITDPIPLDVTGHVTDFEDTNRNKNKNEYYLAATVENEQILGSITVIKNAVASASASAAKLNGAEFTLYTDAACKNKVTGTNIINPVTTSGDGTAVFQNLPVGTYYVKETKAPTGYTLNSRISKVVITGNSVTGTAVSNPSSLTFTDERIQVYISKQDLTGGTELSGAKLEVRDTSGNVIDSWTSGASSHRIPYDKLETGKIYFLRETAAPNGYGYAEEIEFTVNSDGSITIRNGKGELGTDGKTIIMRDRPITLYVSKQGIDTTGAVETENLPGALLAIYDGNKEIHRWTSSSRRYQIPAGILTAPSTGYKEYTLRELSAPNGYLPADNLRFAVGSDGTIYSIDINGAYQTLTGNVITIQDSQKQTGSIYVRKVDSSTGLALAGATFILTDASGTQIDTWVSSGGVKEIKNLSLNEHYYLEETVAPVGYAGMLESIEFYLNDDGKIIIVSGDKTILNSSKDTLTIQNEPIRLQIIKQDEWGSSLPGATLEIYRCDDSTGIYDPASTPIVTFVSEGEDGTVIDCTLLECGETYALHEVTPPEGYQLAADIIFDIDAKGKVIRKDGTSVHNGIVIMQDEEAGLSVQKVSAEDGTPLDGCELELTSIDDPNWETQTWISNAAAPETWDPLEVTPGCTYQLREITAPKGYAYTNSIEFYISPINNQVYIRGEMQPHRTVKIADGMLRLTVSKQDVFDKTEVPNAVLGIYDEYDQLVVSWTTGTEAQAVDTSNLIAGEEEDSYKEYTLREITPPEGYYKAEDIHFAIGWDGTIYSVEENRNGEKVYTLADDNLLTMYEEPMVSISKQDLAGEEVPGATLTVTAKDDPDFEPFSWVSGDMPKYFETGAFKPGCTYVLTETNAPKGYAYAESIEFRIEEDGTVYVNGKKIDNRSIVMVDDVIQVWISKQDITNGRELSGAKLTVKDEAGNVIYSFTSTDQPTMLPGELFTTPKPGEMAYFSLTEITAPEGYEVAETIYFALDSYGQVYIRDAGGNYVLLTDHMVVMKDQPVVTDSDSDGSSRLGVPKTGDNRPITGILLLAMISLFGFLLLLYGFLFGKRGIFGQK